MPKEDGESSCVKKEVTEALFSLLESKDFSDITVTDIVREAGVARASFYRNFDSKQMVVEEAVASICRELSVAEATPNMKALCSHDLLAERLERSLTYVLKKKTLLLLLYQKGFGDLVLDSMNRYMENVAGDMPCTSMERYQLYFVTGAVFNVLMKWLQAGARESPHELAKACADFLCGNRLADFM